MARRLLLGTLLVLALPDAAWAWRHLGHTWLDEDLPLRFAVADDGSLDTECEDTVPPGTCVSAVIAAYETWEAVPGTGLTSVYDGPGPADGPNAGDLRNTVTFDDPLDVLEPGVVAGTFTVATDIAFILDDRAYHHATDSDIVFNDNVLFAPHGTIVAGPCGGARDLQAAATHEVGHLLGLGHACEKTELCLDIDREQAAMYWATEECSTSQASLTSDDIEGLDALYGNRAAFSCSHMDGPDHATGAVPFELKCALDDPALVAAATWWFGEGDPVEGIAADHLYERPGTYDVRVTAHSIDPTGSGLEWSATRDRDDFVRACGTPAVAFALEHIQARDFQVLNETEIGAHGCVSEIRWDVFEGEGLTGDAVLYSEGWEPRLTFPDSGTYTVLGQVGGFAGTGAAELTLDVGTASRGCATAPWPGPPWIWLLILGVSTARAGRRSA